MTEQSRIAIRIHDLHKTYAGKVPKEALKGIRFDIKKGAIFGLLGPNGAGKSTLINILASLVNKTSGTVEIWGNDLDKQNRACRSAIGIVPQEVALDPYFTPRKALDLVAGFYAVPKAERRTEEILEAVGLLDKADAYARSLSGGMKRRLMVAKAMVHNPPILVLDEPTAGVDVELRRGLWEQVKKLNALGVTIVLTTHYLEEAEALCDEIAIINHGVLVAHDSTDALLHRLDSKSLIVTLKDPLEDIPELLTRFNPVREDANKLRFTFSTREASVNDILRAIRHATLEVKDLSTQEPDLEDTFLAITREGP